MKKLASLAIVGAVALLVGCGGGGDSTPDARVVVFPDSGQNGTPDASTTPTIDATPAACNAVSQQGCMPGEKCTAVTQADMSSVVQCAANGAVAIGQACMTSANGMPDDCVAGAYCSGGTCKQICDADLPNSCAAGSNCTEFNGLDIDICLAECDLLQQNCGPGEGCYISISGVACAPTVVDGMAGDPCECANCCVAGLACLGNSKTMEFECVALCDYSMNPDMGDPRCKPAEICVQFDPDDPIVGACAEDTGGM